MTKKRFLTITIDEDIFLKYKALCKENDVQMSRLVRQFIRTWIKEQQRLKKLEIL